MFYEGGVLGRTDNMTIYKGTNIYQAAVENIVSSFPEASDYFQLIITRKDDEDQMRVRIEPSPYVKEDQYANLSQKISLKIKQDIGVSLPVDIVPIESLPRFEVKTKRVIDDRPKEFKTELARKVKTFE